MDRALATWLQLREPADTAARSGELTRAIAAALAGRERVQVLDLATGTGANLRYLAPHLPSRQHWLVVDRDPVLLARLADRTASWAAEYGYDIVQRPGGFVIRGAQLECHVETRQQDLGSLAALNLFAGRDLVTASALLDLASESWLHELAARCRAEGAAASFALTYDGRSSCSPAEPEDDAIRELLNRHQLRDKGLGGFAAGPEAARCAARCFTEAGYRVRAEPTDWSLGPAEDQLQRELIAGWTDVAAEMGFDRSAVASWRDRRTVHLDSGRSRIRVGHLDLVAVPPR